MNPNFTISSLEIQEKLYNYKQALISLPFIHFYSQLTKTESKLHQLIANNPNTELIKNDLERLKS